MTKLEGVNDVQPRISSLVIPLQPEASVITLEPSNYRGLQDFGHEAKLKYQLIDLFSLAGHISLLFK